MSFLWRAYLSNSEVIDEGADDRYPSSEDLPKEEVVRLEYVPLDKDQKSVGLDIDVRNGERFFRYWRKFQSISLGMEPIKGPADVCIMGIQKDGVKLISVYVYPDNTVVVSTNHEL